MGAVLGLIAWTVNVLNHGAGAKLGTILHWIISLALALAAGGIAAAATGFAGYGISIAVVRFTGISSDYLLVGMLLTQVLIAVIGLFGFIYALVSLLKFFRGRTERSTQSRAFPAFTRQKNWVEDDKPLP